MSWPTHNFIFSPATIINVIHSTNLKFIPIFFISLFAFGFILNMPVAFGQVADFNGDFEDKTSVSVFYGFSQNGLGCSGLLGTDTKTVQRPLDWTFVTQTIDGSQSQATFFFDNARITSQSSSGTSGLEINFIPQDDCEINITDSPDFSPVGNVTNGYIVTATSPEIFLGDNDFFLRFEGATSDRYVVKDNGFFTIRPDHYGDTCILQNFENDVAETVQECVILDNLQGIPLEIKADLQLEIFFNTTGGSNSSQIIFQDQIKEQLPDNSVTNNAGIDFSNTVTFATLEIDLRQILPNDVDTIQLNFSTFELDSTSRQMNGIVIDNVRFDPIVILPSPAVNYIEEMINMTDFTITSLEDNLLTGNVLTTGNSELFISRNFGGVALARFKYEINCGGTFGSGGFSPQSIVLEYNDQTTLDVANFSFAHDTCCTGDSVLNYLFPIVRPENLNKIRFIAVQPFSACAPFPFDEFNVTPDNRLAEIRQSFDNTITNGETFVGQADLFPLLVFDNQLNGIVNQTYSFYNFGFNTENPSALTNVLFELRDSTGQLINIDSQDKAVTSAFPLISSGNFDPEPLDYFVTFNDWLTSFAVEDTDTISVKTVGITQAIGTNSESPYSSNATTSFLVGVSTVVSTCENQCVGRDLKTVLSQSTFGTNQTICTFTVDFDNAQCIANLTGVPLVEDDVTTFSSNSTTALLGLQDDLNDAGLGFLGIFITPLFIVILVMVALGGYVEMKVSSGGIAFALITITFSLFFALPQIAIFPIELTLLVIILAGILIANKLTKTFGLGGGGE